MIILIKKANQLLAVLSMNILPFERYDIESEMSINELFASIDQGCESWSFSYAYSGAVSKPLLGGRQGMNFKLYRAIRYHNSFLPIAFGRITKIDGKSVVKITLRMNILVMVFMAIWLSFTLIGAISITSSEHGAPVLIPVGMFFFGYLLMQGSFWFEAPKLKKLTYEIIIKNS